MGKEVFIYVVLERWLRSLKEYKIDFLYWIRNKYIIKENYFAENPDELYWALLELKYPINSQAYKVLETWETNEKIEFLCARLTDLLHVTKGSNAKNGGKKARYPKYRLSNVKFEGFFEIASEANLALELLLALPEETVSLDKTEFIGEKSIAIQWAKAMKAMRILKDPLSDKEISDVALAHMLNVKFPNIKFCNTEIRKPYKKTDVLEKKFKKAIEINIIQKRGKNR
jgi:hypothetical protein